MTADLFGLEQQTPRTISRPEAAALVEVLKALRTHPAVAWAERMNTGAAKVGNRFIRFGWPGCHDVLGQLKDGRFLAVEVKAQAGRLRPEQALFLERIRCAGGVAFVARDCRDGAAHLGRGASPVTSRTAAIHSPTLKDNHVPKIIRATAAQSHASRDCSI